MGIIHHIALSTGRIHIGIGQVKTRFLGQVIVQPQTAAASNRCPDSIQGVHSIKHIELPKGGTFSLPISGQFHIVVHHSFTLNTGGVG